MNDKPVVGSSNSCNSDLDLAWRTFLMNSASDRDPWEAFVAAWHARGALIGNKPHGNETGELAPIFTVCGSCQRKATVTSQVDVRLLGIICERADCPGRPTLKAAAPQAVCQFNEQTGGCHWIACENPDPGSPTGCPLPWPKANAPDTETSLAQYVNWTHKESRVVREYGELVQRAEKNGSEQP